MPAARAAATSTCPISCIDPPADLTIQDGSTFSPGGLQMAAFRASGAHLLEAGCAPGHEKSPFSARHHLNVDPS